MAVLCGQLQQAVEERPLLPAVWRETTTASDWVLRLTPARATELRDRILGLLEAAEEDEGPEAEQVVFQTHTFPLPGRVGPTEEDGS